MRPRCRSPCSLPATFCGTASEMRKVSCNAIGPLRPRYKKTPCSECADLVTSCRDQMTEHSWMRFAPRTRNGSPRKQFRVALRNPRQEKQKCKGREAFASRPSPTSPLALVLFLVFAFLGFLFLV